MKLFLTSSGMEVKDEFLKILPKSPCEIKIAHIITASKPEKDTDYVIKDRKQMIDLGFTVEDIDIENKTEGELFEKLVVSDIICVQGGNTFYLLKQVKESGFDSVVKKLVNQGKIYMGISAGSYIACPTIEQATWKHQDRNTFGLTDLGALNLVPFLISAHFIENYRPIIEKAVTTTKYPVVALYDTQAILIENNTCKIVGIGNKVFFNRFKES